MEEETDVKTGRFIVFSVLFLLISIFIGKGLAQDKYYKQYGGETLAYDEQTGVYHTRYLSLPDGKYEVILGYYAAKDCVIDIGGTECLLESVETEGGEEFRSFNVELNDPMEMFRISTPYDPGEDLVIYEYEIKMSRPYNNDAYYIAFLVFLTGIIISYLICKGCFSRMKKEEKITLLILVSCIIFSCLPLFKDYIVYGHDIDGQVNRIEGLKCAIKDGHFLCVIYPNINNGYGEMAFLYPQVFLYIPAFLRLLNISMPLTWATLLVLINIATGFMAYHGFKQISGTGYGALTATVLYLLAPYRLSDMYVRASLGEVMAMAFFPLIIAGLYHIIKGNSKKYYYLTLGFLGVLSSHILSIGLAGIMVILILLLCIKDVMKEMRYLGIIKAAGWFMIPFVPYLVIFLKLYGAADVGAIKIVNFYRYTLYPAQMFMTKTSTFVMMDLKDGIGYEMTQSIGLIGGAVIVFGLCYHLICNKTEYKVDKGFVTALDITAVVFLFAASTLCPWNYINRIKLFDVITGMIQFPLRFLSIVTVILAFCAGIFTEECISNAEHKRIAVTLLIAVSVLTAQDIIDTTLTAEVYISDIDGTYAQKTHNEYYPPGTDPVIFRDRSAYGNGISIDGYSKSGTNVLLNYTVTDGGEDNSVLLPLLYYPGYAAVDGEGNRLPVSKGEDNRVKVMIPQGNDEGSLRVYYSIRELFR